MAIRRMPWIPAFAGMTSTGPAQPRVNSGGKCLMKKGKMASTTPQTKKYLEEEEGNP